ncbi:MAG TPA: hypothetical protein VLS90_19755 [Thermodesulfobacteriota bacterium]|nr:hypothetical protein [Thermodesulfobacteriota bacterium]
MNGKLWAPAFWIALLLAGCAHPQPGKSASGVESVDKGEILMMAVEVAKSMNFPEVTRFDREEGVVEFGSFGRQVVGLTAQVKISPDNASVGIVVKRGSVYVPVSAEPTGQEFMRKFQEKLKRKQAT